MNKGIKRLERILEDRKEDWAKKLLALVGLSNVLSKDSFTILERYYRNPDPQMKLYAKLAFMQAKRMARAY